MLAKLFNKIAGSSWWTLMEMVFVVVGSAWLIWVLLTRYSPDWAALEWGGIAVVFLSVLSSAYGLIKEMRGR